MININLTNLQYLLLLLNLLNCPILNLKSKSKLIILSIEKFIQDN